MIIGLSKKLFGKTSKSKDKKGEENQLNQDFEEQKGLIFYSRTDPSLKKKDRHKEVKEAKQKENHHKKGKHHEKKEKKHDKNDKKHEKKHEKNKKSKKKKHKEKDHLDDNSQIQPLNLFNSYHSHSQESDQNQEGGEPKIHTHKQRRRFKDQSSQRRRRHQRLPWIISSRDLIDRLEKNKKEKKRGEKKDKKINHLTNIRQYELSQEAHLGFDDPLSLPHPSRRRGLSQKDKKVKKGSEKRKRMRDHDRNKRNKKQK